MTARIDSSDNTIDSRDILKRIAELEEIVKDASHGDEIDGLEDAISVLEDELSKLLLDAHGLGIENFDRRTEIETDLDNIKAELNRLIALVNETDVEDEEAELEALKAVIAEIGETNAEFGVTLIREGYFTEYAQETSEVPNNDWPYNHINWEEAADELKVDYSTLEFDDVDWYYHS